MWELTTDRITRVSPWVTVKGVETQTATVQLVCYWVTVVGVGTRTATASLVLTGGERLKVWEHESQLTDQRGLPYGLRLRV